MRPEDVPDALIARAPSPVEFAGRGLPAEEYVRHLLAAVLSLEEVWVGGPDALPLPPQVITHEGVFHEDGVTPLQITDESMRAGGWKRRRRLSTEWEDA